MKDARKIMAQAAHQLAAAAEKDAKAAESLRAAQRAQTEAELARGACEPAVVQDSSALSMLLAAHYAERWLVAVKLISPGGRPLETGSPPSVQRALLLLERGETAAAEECLRLVVVAAEAQPDLFLGIEGEDQVPASVMQAVHLFRFDTSAMLRLAGKSDALRRQPGEFDVAAAKELLGEYAAVTAVAHRGLQRASVFRQQSLRPPICWNLMTHFLTHVSVAYIRLHLMCSQFFISMPPDADLDHPAGQHAMMEFGHIIFDTFERLVPGAVLRCPPSCGCGGNCISGAKSGDGGGAGSSRGSSGSSTGSAY